MVETRKSIHFCLFQARLLLCFFKHFQTPPKDPFHRPLTHMPVIHALCWSSLPQLPVIVTNICDEPSKKRREFFCLTTQMIPCVCGWPLVLCWGKTFWWGEKRKEGFLSFDSEEAKKQSQGPHLAFRGMHKWPSILPLQNTWHGFHHILRAPWALTKSSPTHGLWRTFRIQAAVKMGVDVLFWKTLIYVSYIFSLLYPSPFQHLNTR